MGGRASLLGYARLLGTRLHGRGAGGALKAPSSTHHAPEHPDRQLHRRRCPVRSCPTARSTIVRQACGHAGTSILTTRKETVQHGTGVPASRQDLAIRVNPPRPSPSPGARPRGRRAVAAGMDAAGGGAPGPAARDTGPPHSAAFTGLPAVVAQHFAHRIPQRSSPTLDRVGVFARIVSRDAAMLADDSLLACQTISTRRRRRRRIRSFSPRPAPTAPLTPMFAFRPARPTGTRQASRDRVETEPLKRARRDDD